MASVAAVTNLAPLSYVFDDLIRHYDQYISSDTSPEFLEFAINQEDCRVKWYNAEEEFKRLQGELEGSQTEISRLERKIQETRKHLEGKMKLVNKAELDKEQIEGRVNAARALLKAYLKDAKMGNEFKDRLINVLAVLETGDRTGISIIKSPAHGLDTISEAGSTDLSMTQSEDDLDLSVARNRRLRPKRGSIPNQTQELPSKRSRHSKNVAEREHTSTTEQLITKTIVSFPKDGPVSAVASIEAYPNNSIYTSTKPSAPPLPTSESESEVGGWMNIEKGKGKSSPAVLHENHRFMNQVPSSSNQSPRFGRTLSSGGSMAIRPHAFCQKTVIKPENCEPCGKRIRFSKVALKCRDCKATCHPECKEKVPIPCVPTGTPSNKHQMGTIADYVPAQHPMVPALIQHCVNEIEVRGLDTVGLYRVPGPERDVKDLKEKFLRGKGVPNLARYDIHAICGCVKDFLRSLQEPLVSRWFWRDFALATEISDQSKRQAEMERIIHDLPPPNQDTLGFMLLHLQRVAESIEVKMPIGNLSKIFGPTIVGYSGNDLDGAELLKETKKQQMVLETLLNMPGEFWKKFAYRPQQEGKIYSSGGGTYTRSKGKTMASPYTPHAPPSSTSSNLDRVRNNGKKIYFSDDSPKEGMKTRSQKRNFFD